MGFNSNYTKNVSLNMSTLPTFTAITLRNSSHSKNGLTLQK